MITTVKGLHNWLHKYLPTNEKREQHLHGYCLELSEEIISKLGQYADYEQWELWELDKGYSHLPFIVGETKLPNLCDIGIFFHVVIKWKGLYWDASGVHSDLRVKTKPYTKIINPHWLRTG